VHCVGSRDEKVNVKHCSKVCCITGVKQSIELKERYPEAQVFCFYMDLRMFGMGYEELYKEAQEKYGIQFIRGRLSEAFENQDGSVLVKVEDTLAGKPLKMSVDLLVLLVGFLPSQGTRKMAELLGLQLNSGDFLKPVDQHVGSNISNIPGIFLAGACKSPKNIEESLSDARAAAAKVHSYLANSEQ
jgi:heterodisulfide reductase subunit A2